MRIDVITLFPQMFSAVTDAGVTGRAVQKGILQVNTWNPRDYAKDNYRTVDDRPYGGGPGMVMMVEPLRNAIEAARKAEATAAKVIYLSPQGQRLSQQALATLATEGRLILLAGRYEGIDERLIKAEVDEEWSIGDYVLSGGELPAMVMIDGMARLIPGVLGHEDSAVQDSFVSGLLDCSHYTRPEEFEGQLVPAVLTSGDHKAIERWRLKQALGRTYERRPDLLEELELDQEQQALLQQYLDERRQNTY
ncbi:MAG: tRNA (guanosine(37)-N1)-methyltransferase TrmD [Gammaproteobacteria bacterium]|nr:tRNA (guanosine(37)-N1)-methyltransferase TrmD [Gammaproteobacteria bacterium]